MRELNTVSQFPDLSWRWYNNVPVLKGIYQFRTEYKGFDFQGSFNLEINFSADYPEKIPFVRELDYQIPATFHRNPNGCLCLCTPAEEYLIFRKEPTLENYIRNILNPYLLSWLWYKKFDKMPWGERRHGLIGLIESYQDLLNLRNIKETKQFMIDYIKNEIHHGHYCPCGSGFHFKKCHRNSILKLQNNLPKGQLVYDFIFILGGLI